MSASTSEGSRARMLTYTIGVVVSGTFHSRMIAEFADGSSNVREIWKFFFKD